MIPHSRPTLGQEEEKAACRVVRSGMLAQGEEVAALERELATRLGVSHVVAVSSGSAALHLALLVLDIGPGDDVMLPTYVCTALLHAIKHMGATPILVDIAANTHQICPTDAKRRQTGALKAILVPHMFGQAAPITAQEPLGVPIIEDCALSLGATINNRPLGSFGQVSVFSFYATKVICGGEGGAIATSDKTRADRLRDLRDYDGRTDDCVRFNYKLTDLQAAIIRVQLQKLEGFITRRRALGQCYHQALDQTAARLPHFEPGEFPFRYVIHHARSAQNLIRAFDLHGIATRRPVFCPLHNVLNQSNADFPNASQAFEHALSLPLYPALVEREMDHILKTAQEIL